MYNCIRKNSNKNDMKREYKNPLILFLIGMIFTIFGSLLKIMHWPFANIFLIVGMGFEIFAILSIIKLLLKKK
jgi:hypothetical protein